MNSLLEFVQCALSSGRDVNDATDDGLTPLMLASKQGDESVVDYLLEQPGLELNKTDKEGRTALHHASSNRRVGVVRRLLGQQDHSSIEMKTEAGKTPIMMAVELGDMDTAKELLSLPDMDTVSRVTEWEVLERLVVKSGHLKAWQTMTLELKAIYSERLQESTRRLKEKSKENVHIMRRMQKEKTTLTNQIFYGDSKCRNSNTGVCAEKETSKTLKRLEEKVMRREATAKIRTAITNDQGTEGKEVLDNARIDQILSSLEPSTTSKSTLNKNKPKKSKKTSLPKNQETLPKALAKSEMSSQVIQQASDNNDIKEDCPTTVVNKGQDISENNTLQITFDDKLACLEMERYNANIVVSSKAKEMASLVTKMEIAENQMMIVSTEMAQLEVRKAQLTSTYSETSEIFNRLKRKQVELEQLISTSLADTSLNIATLEKELKVLEVKMVSGKEHTNNETKEHYSSLENIYIESLNVKIIAKEQELECPVCLETASSPILMCEEQHLICNNCRPKLTSCPECRVAYTKQNKRHRYAEKIAEELEALRRERTNIFEASIDGCTMK